MWATGAYGYLSDYLLWWLVLASLIAHTWCFFHLWDARRRPRRRLVIGNVLVGACLLAFSALIAETYLRFVSTATDAFGTTLTARRWFKVFPQLNSLYFRDIEWTPQKPAGVRRIAFVGDSFTYGWGINDRADRFSDIIQARFDRETPGAVEVMNVAWANWDTQDELSAVDRMIRDYAVDEVVLCYLPNDIDSLLPVSEDFDPTKPPRSRLVNTTTSFLLDFLYYRVYARRSPAARGYWDWLWDGYMDPVIWREHAAALQTMIQICRDRGVRFRVALLPFIRTSGARYDAARLHEKLRDFFEASGVPVVDLLPIVERHDADELVVNRHDPHPNELAHRLFAGAIWEAFYAPSAP